MQNIQSVVEVEVLKGSTVPRKGSDGAAAYDLYSAQSYTLSPRTITAVDLNLQVAIPSGYYMQLGSRSGLCLKGLVIVGGIVDSDYRGPIQALVYNNSGELFKLCKGQRISQALVLAVEDVVWKTVDTLSDTVRGNRGFGSTGQ
jgi:dUTP pyrophosphatase